MRVAVAAVEPDLFAPLSPLGARAPFYLVLDASGHILETITNPHVQATGGVGPKVADMLAAKGVQILIAGALGPGLKEALAGHGIRYLEKAGTVSEVIGELGSG